MIPDEDEIIQTNITIKLPKEVTNEDDAKAYIKNIIMKAINTPDEGDSKSPS